MVRELKVFGLDSRRMRVHHCDGLYDDNQLLIQAIETLLNDKEVAGFRVNVFVTQQYLVPR